MSVKVDIEFAEISGRIHELDLTDYDAIVGIQTGGVVPSVMIAHELRIPLFFIHIHFRDENNQPTYPKPKLISESFQLPLDAKKVLLVDDVSNTGGTFKLAKQQLSAAHVDTLVMKGKADYVLFPEIKPCVNWPWKS